MDIAFRKKPAFGLDLSDQSFKIVQLKKDGGDFAVACFLKNSLPKGLVEHGEIKDTAKLTNFFKDALAEQGDKYSLGRRVVCNLPEEKVFIRVIRLPKMKLEEVSRAIEWEAEAYIPMRVSEVYLDWQIVKSLSLGGDHMDILVAATPHVIVDSYLDFLRAAGLEPVSLEPESVAVSRGILASDLVEPTIIVDLGAMGTNFVIFSAGAIRFTSHVPVSGQLFAEAIEKSLGLEHKEAVKMKIEAGLDGKKQRGKVAKALEPAVEELARQLESYIEFYHDHLKHIFSYDGKIVRVLLCGGDALLVGLPEFLRHRLNLPVEMADPLINVCQQKGALAMNEREALTYTTALGLALRGE